LNALVCVPYCSAVHPLNLLEQHLLPIDALQLTLKVSSVLADTRDKPVTIWILLHEVIV
jgi:hypothetical protein